MTKSAKLNTNSTIRKSKIVYEEFGNYVFDVHFVSRLYKFFIPMENFDESNIAKVEQCGFGLTAKPVKSGYPTIYYHVRGGKGAGRLCKASFCYDNAIVEKPDTTFLAKYIEASEFEINELTPFIKNMLKNGYVISSK